MYFVIMSSKVSREGAAKKQCWMRGPYADVEECFVAATEWRNEVLSPEDFDFIGVSFVHQVSFKVRNMG